MREIEAKINTLLLGALLGVLVVFVSIPSPATVTSNGDGSSTLHVKLGGSAADTLTAVNGICSYFGYQSTINGSPNPESKAVFAERVVREQVLIWVREGRASSAANTARDTANGQALPALQ